MEKKLGKVRDSFRVGFASAKEAIGSPVSAYEEPDPYNIVTLMTQHMNMATLASAHLLLPPSYTLAGHHKAPESRHKALAHHLQNTADKRPTMEALLRYLRMLIHIYRPSSDFTLSIGTVRVYPIEGVDDS